MISILSDRVEFVASLDGMATREKEKGLAKEKFESECILKNNASFVLSNALVSDIGGDIDCIR